MNQKIPRLLAQIDGAFVPIMVAIFKPNPMPKQTGPIAPLEDFTMRFSGERLEGFDLLPPHGENLRWRFDDQIRQREFTAFVKNLQTEHDVVEIGLSVCSMIEDVAP